MQRCHSGGVREEKEGFVAVLCGLFAFSCAFKTSVVFSPLEGGGGKRENGKGKECDSTGKTHRGLVTCRA